MKPHRRAADLALRYNAISILEHNLEDRADKTAVLTPDRDSTFRNVSDEVNRVGNALLGVGLQPGESVAILLPDTTEWATTFFACLKTGTVAVGINTLLTPRELAQILRESRARVLVVHHTLLAGALPSPEDPSFVEHVVVVGGGAHTTAGGGQANTATSAGTATAPTIGGPTIHDWVTWIADEPSTLEATDTHREDFATLNFSSGTTGEPKGIYHTHADLALTAQLWGVDVLGLQADDLAPTALWLVDHEPSPVLLCRRDHAVRRLQVGGHGFIAEHVATGSEGHLGMLGMQGCRQGEDDEIGFDLFETVSQVVMRGRPVPC